MVSRILSTLALASHLATIATGLDLPAYRGLKTASNGSVLHITLHNPSSNINLWNHDTQDGLIDLVHRLRSDNVTKVVIFNSNVPRFFVAQLDLLEPTSESRNTDFVTLMHNITNLPQVTIGAVEGRARGAGNEFLMALDMRFATKNDTFFGQIEVGAGLIPGGGGGQYLPRLIGRGLAMEYILSGNDVGAEDAERLGWINKAFDSSKGMYAYIDGLTSRLQLFPLAAMAAAKASINRSVRPTLQDLLLDADAFGQRLADPATREIGARALVVTKNLTYGEAELNLGESLPLFYE